jgi:hypothetical protein
MTAGYEHGAGSQAEGLHHEVTIDPTSTHHHDVAGIGWILEVTHTCIVSTHAAAPATCEGQDLLLGAVRQKRVNLSKDLPIREVVLGDGVVRTLSNAGPTAVALCGDDLRRNA